MSIDLRPFGLYWDLDPEKMVIPVPSAYRTASVKRSEDSIKFFGSGGEEILKLDLDKELGRGAYGKTYLTKNKINGFTAVVKIIGRSPSYSTMDVITEVISQIIVVKTTEEIDVESIELKGPVAPRVFLFAKDDGYYYIVNELVENNFKTLLKEPDSCKTIKKFIVQIAFALSYLQNFLHFNHRDFKPDNIMFNPTHGVRIIDYGFCCLKYHGMNVTSGYKYPKEVFQTCYSKTRDLNALFYYLLNYSAYKTAACPVKRILRALMYYKSGDPVDWLNSYNAYNRRPETPNMTPRVVFRVFRLVEYLDTEPRNTTFNPSWASEIEEVNEGVLTQLNSEEINKLNPQKLIDFLVAKKSASLSKRISLITHNKNVKAVCNSITPNSPKKKTNGGRKTYRKKRF